MHEPRQLVLSPQTNEHFPCHGWVTGAEGLRHLRMPISQLFRHGGPLFDRYETHSLGGVWLQARSPTNTLRRLAIALRDLHSEVRVAISICKQQWTQREPSPERDAALNRYAEAGDRCEVLLTAVLVLLRRLPDDIFKAAGPLLFKKWGAVPQGFRKIADAAKHGELERLDPLCDLQQLNSILTTDHPWFNNLANQPGIRDVFVHGPHTFHVGARGSQIPGEEMVWTIDAQLTTWSKQDGMKALNVLPIVIESIVGICDFMTSFYKCVGLDQSYQGDYLFLSGKDHDAVGFWPSIEGRAATFPMEEATTSEGPA